MANLMYQKNTKRNFYKGLTKVLSVADTHEVTLAGEEERLDDGS